MLLHMILLRGCRFISKVRLFYSLCFIGKVVIVIMDNNLRSLFLEGFGRVVRNVLVSQWIVADVIVTKLKFVIINFIVLTSAWSQCLAGIYYLIHYNSLLQSFYLGIFNGFIYLIIDWVYYDCVSALLLWFIIVLYD